MLKDKRFIVTICIILFTAFVSSGCNPTQGNNMDWIIENTNSRREIADKIMEYILTAVENKDGNSIVELFSEKALEEVGQEHLKNGAEALFDFCLGTNENYEGNISSHETNHYGKSTLTIQGIYKVTTNQMEYRLHFICHPVNDMDASQIGLSHIVVTTEKKYQEEEFKWEHLDDVPGIYFIE